MGVLRKVGVMSLAKFYALMLAAIGLIYGVLAAVFFSMLGNSMGSEGSALAGLGLAIVIILPILGAIFGFIFGAIGALVLNFALRYSGGLEYEAS